MELNSEPIKRGRGRPRKNKPEIKRSTRIKYIVDFKGEVKEFSTVRQITNEYGKTRGCIGRLLNGENTFRKSNTRELKDLKIKRVG